MRLIYLFVGLFAFTWGLAQADIPPEKKDNLRFACEAAREISGAEADNNFCSCVNEHYSTIMTPVDWEKYSTDYFLLSELNQTKESQSAPNSYERELEIGFGHCAACKEKGYRGCLPKPGAVEMQNKIIQYILAGRFSSISRDVRYKRTFIDYVSAFSTHCRSEISTGKRYTTVSYVNGVYDDSYEIVVSSEFVDSYERYRQTWENAMVGEGMQVILDDLMAGNLFDFSNIVSYGKEVHALTYNMTQIVGSSCGTPMGDTLRENFRRFDNGEPALVNATSRQAAEALDAKDYWGVAASADERARIKAATISSRKRAVERGEARMAAARLNQPLTCQVKGLDRNLGEIPAATKEAISDLSRLQGVWKGQLHGRTAELATWARDPYDLYGLVFFPDLKCMLSLKFIPNPKFSPPEQVGVGAGESASRSGTCSERLGLTGIGKLSTSWFLSGESVNGHFVLAPQSATQAFNAQSNLGFSASCEKPARFSKATAMSPEMKSYLQGEIAAWGMRPPATLPGRRYRSMLGLD